MTTPESQQEGGAQEGGATPAAAPDTGPGPAALGRVAVVTDPLLVLRPLRLLVVAWIAAVVIVVLFTVVAVLMPSTPTGVYFRLADQVALVLIGLFIAGLILLVARPRVRADAQGIDVRNILLTRHVPWDQVRRVAFPDGASFARLDLPDDEYLSVLAIQAVDGQRAVEGIRRVRALHAASRAG